MGKRTEVGEKYGMLTAIKELPRLEWVRKCRTFIWRCDCGKEIVKGCADIKRGRVVSCGCYKQSSEYRANLLEGLHNSSDWNPENIAKHAGNRLDDLSPFRYLYKKVKGRYLDKSQEVSEGLTVEYLRDLWIKQDEKCALTGVKMILFTHTYHYGNPMFQCSVDRIDSCLGYLTDNVHLVTWAANAAKNRYSLEQFHEWLTQVKNV